MTREEARKAAKVMLAYADGKDIEFSFPGKNEWALNCEPQFNWDIGDYRIKPEPKYRPFANKEECWTEMQKHRPFGWVTDYGPYKYIISVEETLVRTDFIKWKFDEAFRKITFADGAPFGIKEE